MVDILGMIKYSIIQFCCLIMVLVGGLILTIICPPLGIIALIICVGLVLFNWLVTMLWCL